MALTPKKRRILDFIRAYQAQHDSMSPTLREIADHMGLRSVSTVHVHLEGLRQAGMIEYARNAKRGIRILGRGKEPLPLMGYIAAGKPIESIADAREMDISEVLLAGGANYILQVTGDSMIDDGIQDGDFVIIRRSREAREGEMVVALVDGEVTLKRFYPENGRVRLQPSNPRMEPLYYPADDVKIQGVVVGLMRKY